jgi:hypothetical protein
VSHRTSLPQTAPLRTVHEVSRLTRITMVRRANIGRMNVDVTCACGYRWESHSASGRTRCRRCGKRVYIPLRVRRKAGLDLPTTGGDNPLLYSRRKARTTTPATADRTTVPQPDQSPFASRPEPRLLEPSVRPSTWVTDAIARITSTAPKPSPAVPRVTAPRSSPSAPAPPTAPAHHKPGGYLVLKVACGCQLLSGTATPPAEIRCPVHGRVATRTSRRVQTLPNDRTVVYGSPAD